MSKHAQKPPLITDDGSMEHVLRMFAGDGLGMLDAPPGAYHKFKRAPGGCVCAVCGQGEAFAAHRSPQV